MRTLVFAAGTSEREGCLTHAPQISADPPFPSLMDVDGKSVRQRRKCADARLVETCFSHALYNGIAALGRANSASCVLFCISGVAFYLIGSWAHGRKGTRCRPSAAGRSSAYANHRVLGALAEPWRIAA